MRHEKLATHKHLRKFYDTIWGSYQTLYRSHPSPVTWNEILRSLHMSSCGKMGIPCRLTESQSSLVGWLVGWIGCLTSHSIIFKLYVWRHIDVHVDLKKVNLRSYSQSHRYFVWVLWDTRPTQSSKHTTKPQQIYLFLLTFFIVTPC